jgi:hypothetical protein
MKDLNSMVKRKHWIRTYFKDFKLDVYEYYYDDTKTLW